MRKNIEALNARNLNDVNKCEAEVFVEAKICLFFKNDEILYTIMAVPGSKKRYGLDKVDYTSYMDGVDKAVFLAYVEGQIAGQIILRKNWNKYATIEDIAVDVKFRRRGIDRA